MLHRLRPLRRLALTSAAFPLSVALAPVLACTQPANDPAADAGVPSALGSGERIRDVMDPSNPAHGINGEKVTITGSTFLLVDSYDETHDGKSIGTVYVQDVPPSGSPPPPFSGVAIYDPTYLPTSLVPAPGDVLDFTGTFSVSTSLGSAVFDTGTSLIQIDKPVMTPRFEYMLPPPMLIHAGDLDAPTQTAYNSAQQWVSMLVTIQNVTFTSALAVDSAQRATIDIMSDTGEDGPAMDNELFDLVSWNNSITPHPLQQGTTIKSVTGIVTWFFSYHIAPRSPADIVLE